LYNNKNIIGCSRNVFFPEEFCLLVSLIVWWKSTQEELVTSFFRIGESALLAASYMTVPCMAYSSTLKMESYVPPKAQFTFTEQYRVVCQNMYLFIITVVIISNPMYSFWFEIMNRKLKMVINIPQFLIQISSLLTSLKYGMTPRPKKLYYTWRLKYVSTSYTNFYIT
jgi:hypothetical protein